MLVFSGEGMDGFLEDFWSYNTGDNVWTQIVSSNNPPPPRLYSFVLPAKGDGGQDQLFIGGGVDENDQPLSDVSGYNPADNSWMPYPPAPSPLGAHPAVVYQYNLYVFLGPTLLRFDPVS